MAPEKFRSLRCEGVFSVSGFLYDSNVCSSRVVGCRRGWRGWNRPRLWPLSSPACLLRICLVTTGSGCCRPISGLASFFQAQVFEAMASISELMSELEADPEIAAESAAAEIGAALHLTRRAADADLALAVDLKERLPEVWEALAAGKIDLRRARVIVHGTAHLSEVTAREVVARILEAAARLTTGQLGRSDPPGLCPGRSRRRRHPIRGSGGRAAGRDGTVRGWDRPPVRVGSAPRPGPSGDATDRRPGPRPQNRGRDQNHRSAPSRHLLRPA